MPREGGIGLDELTLAARNHGFPLEALEWDVTPIGLHYLLIHYDVPRVDPAAWQLTIDGAVSGARSVTLAELTGMPQRTHRVTMECAGNGRARLDPRPISQPWLVHAVGTAEWSGVPLAALLEPARLDARAVEVLFTGLDRGVDGGEEQAYQRSLAVEEALSDGVLVATHMNGVPVPPQHGAPARLVVPGWYGMTNVKWLTSITVLTEPFTGYQQRHAYRYRTVPEEPGRPVTRMLPRSLIRPPGIPDFMSRRRFVPSGTLTLAGRAWSGFAPIVRVELSDDGGLSWHDAEVEPPVSPHAWQAWGWEWNAASGAHVLCSRATDDTGRSQPVTPEWNVGGYEVNAVHLVAVEVG